MGAADLMDINQIVAELEDQAARYAQAANALRTLLPLKQPAIPAVVRQAIAPKSAAKAANGKSGNSGKKKSTVSDETRAKISAAIKAAHERRKAAAAASNS